MKSYCLGKLRHFVIYYNYYKIINQKGRYTDISEL